MLTENVTNQMGIRNSLQVSKMGIISLGTFNPGVNFLIKNITEDNVTVTIQPSSNSNTISTVLYPGWNPEICSKVVNAPANKLQYGY